MEVVDFTYKKSSGEVSQRSLVVLQKPSDKLQGIDITELTLEEREEFAKVMSAIFDDYLAQLAHVKDAWGLTNAHRMFIPGQISDMTTKSYA